MAVRPRPTSFKEEIRHSGVGPKEGIHRRRSADGSARRHNEFSALKINGRHLNPWEDLPGQCRLDFGAPAFGALKENLQFNTQARD
jgi:hypothetical protein